MFHRGEKEDVPLSPVFPKCNTCADAVAHLLRLVCGCAQLVTSLSGPVIQGKINRPLMRLLNHKPVKTADQKIEEQPGLIGDPLKVVEGGS